jgi:4-amino-4-deoxy-L-arabinose transferase-like glycosyltransferase
VRRAAFVPIVLALVTFFTGLGRGAITDSDEAFYAEAAREMVETGDWLTPTFNYQPRFQKPVLYYWFTAATYVVAGSTEAAARFWSACSGLGLVLVTVAAARRWLDTETAALAGAIAATNFGYFVLGRAALPDLPLTFAITLGTYALLVALLELERHARRWLLLAAASLALGFLTKGPVAVALPVLVVGPLLLVERRGLRAGVGDWTAAALVFTAIAAPWYIAMWARHGMEYVQGFFVGDNLERFMTDRFNEPRPWWFYAPVIAGGLLPWTPLAVVWVAPVWQWLTRRRRIAAIEIRLIVWALVPLLFYSISIGKQPRYVLPVLPPLAILLAASILHRTRVGSSPDAADVRSRIRRSVVIGAVMSGLIFIALGIGLYFLRDLIINVPDASTTVFALLIGAAGAAVVSIGISRAWRMAPWAVAVAAAVALPALQAGAIPSRSDTVEQMAERVTRERRAAEAVTAYGVFVRNLVFYTRIRQDEVYSDEQFRDFLQRQERVLAVVPTAVLERVEREQGVKVTRLAELPYFNTGAIRIGTLLGSNGSRAEEVSLVSNR